MNATNEQMEQLFETHEAVLRFAADQRGFRVNEPEGGPEAMEAGLIAESDPHWQYSDDPRAGNGYSLTKLGQSVVEAQGWTCTCAGHRMIAALNGVRVTIATDGMCGNCRGSASQYGMKQHEGEPSCSMCLKMAESHRNRDAAEASAREDGRGNAGAESSA